MKLVKVGAIATVAIAIGLAAAAFAFAALEPSGGGQSLALPGQEAPPERSGRASEVEGDIAVTNVVGRMEAALGSDFAGAWFDAATARLHVGVTSGESRLTAAAVASRASLAPEVVETPVHSTWGQLIAAQERWSARLTDLFDREEVSTALRARYNALEIDLSSTVPASERVALEHEADATDVNVKVVVMPEKHLGLELDARCNEFKTKVANCDPSIVAGVRILNEADGGCSAGPAVFPEDHTKPTDTYILTAGHCIEKAGGEGKKWYAKNKKLEKKEIGLAAQFINGKAGDMGAIKVEKADWTNNGFTPVNPTIAPWNENPNPEPFPVTGQAEPTEGVEVCMSGGSTGTSCGEITKLGVEFNGKQGMAEVAAARENGDSGAPWYAAGHREIVEGTHVGGGAGYAVFEPLSTTFKELTKPKLQLLTDGNKERHAFQIQSESAPVTLTGQQHAGGSSVFGTTAGSFKCTEGSYTGELSGTASIEFEMTSVAYGGCTAFGLYTGTIETNGCHYRFTVTKINEGKREGRFDLSCPAETEITATATQAGVPKCTIHVPPQTGLGTVTYTNIGSGTTREITLDVKLTGIKYTHTTGIGLGSCASGSGETGTFETSVSIKAENIEKKQVGLFTS